MGLGLIGVGMWMGIDKDVRAYLVGKHNLFICKMFTVIIVQKMYLVKVVLCAYGYME